MGDVGRAVLALLALAVILIGAGINNLWFLVVGLVASLFMIARWP